ncbi:unnamed protein product [Parajaminaea phylloscopi]
MATMNVKSIQHRATSLDDIAKTAAPVISAEHADQGHLKGPEAPTEKKAVLSMLTKGITRATNHLLRQLRIVTAFPSGMPITLKLAGRSKPAASRAQESGGAASALPTSKASPHTRTVSFSEQNSYSEPEPLQSSSLSFSQQRPTPAAQSTSDAVATPSSLTSAEPSASKSVASRRPRSPTPPSAGVAYCAPVGCATSIANDAESHTRKRRRSSASNQVPLVASASRSQSISADEAALCLEGAVKRYAGLAGYDALQSGAIELLRDWLEWYLEHLAFLGSAYATSSGRTLPGSRDLLEAVMRVGQLDDVEAPASTEETPTAAPDNPWNVESLIEWRHRVPDYEGDYPHRRARQSVAPEWAQDRPVSLVFSNTQPSHNGHGPLQLPVSSLPAGPVAGMNADHDETNGHARRNHTELLSERSRRREKSARSEIPSHLPELPALHTWKRTDAYPSNHLSSKLDHWQAAGGQHEDVDCANSPGTGIDDAQNGRSTLARLETRLVSSRLVQTSLSALIGRLDGAASIAAAPQTSTRALDTSGLNRTSGSPMSPQTATLPQGSPRSRRSERDREKSATQSASEVITGPATPGTTTPSASGASSKLSIRLRTTSSSQTLGHSAAHDSASVPQPFSSHSKVAQPSPVATPSTGGASPFPSTNLISRRGLHMGAPSLTLDTNSAAGGWRQAIPGSAGGFVGSRLATSAYPSPATPFTPFTGASSLWNPAAAANVRGFPAAGNNTAQDGTGALNSALATPTTPWPFFAHSPSLPASAGEGGVVQSQNPAHCVLPAVVNFKAGWYARKV